MNGKWDFISEKLLAQGPNPEARFYIIAEPPM